MEALDEGMLSLLCQINSLHKVRVRSCVPSSQSLTEFLHKPVLMIKSYKDALLEIRKLRAKVSIETQKREAVEAFGHSIDQESNRLSKAQGATFSKLVQQLESRSQFEDLLHELKSLKMQLESKEEEHRTLSQALSDKYSGEIVALQNQIRQSQEELTFRDAAVAHLEQELSCLRLSMRDLQQSSEKAFQSATLKYQEETSELKHKLDLVAHNTNLLEDRALQEKQMLQNQLDSVEKQLLTERADFEKRSRESSFSRHSEVYKQKIMRLRKENEDLRRQLHGIVLN